MHSTSIHSCGLHSAFLKTNYIPTRHTSFYECKSDTRSPYTCHFSRHLWHIVTTRVLDNAQTMATILSDAPKENSAKENNLPVTFCFVIKKHETYSSKKGSFLLISPLATYNFKKNRQAIEYHQKTWKKPLCSHTTDDINQ